VANKVSGWTKGQLAEVRRAQTAGFPIESPCPSGKRTFASRTKAKRQLRLLQSRRNTQKKRRKAEVSIYQCPDCSQWHLTSIPRT